MTRYTASNPPCQTAQEQPHCWLRRIGSLALALLVLAGDKSAAVKSGLVFYKPKGALSGVTLAILSWFLAWGLLEWRWGKRHDAMSRINIVSLLILIVSILLTFPPIVNFV